MKMIPEIVWDKIKKVIPVKKSKVGRPEHNSKKTFEGILYVLETGCQWKNLPKNFGKPSTVHGKFMKWAREGIIEKMFDYARRDYIKKKNVPLNWFATDTSSSKAPFALWGGKNPTDRSKNGVKKNIIVDRSGLPLAVDVAPANVHDSQLFEALLNQMQHLDLASLKIITADAAYDVKKLRNKSKNQNFILLASTNPRRKKNVRKYRPLHRWIVERTFGWLHWYRGIKTCWSKTKIAFMGLLQIAAIIKLYGVK